MNGLANTIIWDVPYNMSYNMSSKKLQLQTILVLIEHYISLLERINSFTYWVFFFISFVVF